jgi:hypothetical protein
MPGPPLALVQGRALEPELVQGPVQGPELVWQPLQPPWLQLPLHLSSFAPPSAVRQILAAFHAPQHDVPRPPSSF